MCLPPSSGINERGRMCEIEQTMGEFIVISGWFSGARGWFNDSRELLGVGYSLFTSLTPLKGYPPLLEGILKFRTVRGKSFYVKLFVRRSSICWSLLWSPRCCVFLRSKKSSLENHHCAPLTEMWSCGTTKTLHPRYKQ